MAPHSSTLAWKIPWTEGAWQATVHGVTKSKTRLSDFTFTFTFHFPALEKEMAAHSSVLAWRIPGTESLVGCRLWGRTESDTTEAAEQQQPWHNIVNYASAKNGFYKRSQLRLPQQTASTLINSQWSRVSPSSLQLQNLILSMPQS